MRQVRDVAIFGVGGFGREVLTLINDINTQEEMWHVVGFFDDGYPVGYEVHGLKNLGGVKELNTWNTPLSVVIAIGTPRIKKTIIRHVDNPLVDYPTLIHPSVIIGDKESVKIGKGCILCAYTVVTCDVTIADYVILNLACTVGHDTVIKDYAAFMPTCNISGEVEIGEGVYCGTGVKIINQTSIGDNTIVGAGAVVTRPLPANCTAVGMPAQPIKFH